MKKKIFRTRKMIKILRLEIIKTFKKWRTYIGFATVGIIIPMIGLAIKLSGEHLDKGPMRQFQEEFIIVGNLFNGWFFSHLIMNSLFIHIPFLIALVAGDILAGEATAGTYRILLTHYASRTKILIIKYFTTLIYSILLIAFMAILSLGFGYLFFGGGDLIIFGKEILLLPPDDLLFRFLVAYFCATVAMWTIASLAFLFSSFVENAIGPIIGTMSVLIIFLVISEMPLEIFDSIRPFLFTTYTSAWMKVFNDPIPYGEIIKSLGYLTLYSASFFITTLFYFKRKDILS